MAQRVLAFLALIVLASAFEGLIDGPSKGRDGEDLPSGVSIIDGTSANITDNSDLWRFSRLAHRAHIFGIGESAHGVAGYQDFQFRLSKWLIEHWGYRRIFSEIITDDRALNEYLLTGQGNLTTILYLNPWYGSDRNMYDFFSWVRLWNTQHSDKVTVHIVDPQAPWENAPLIGASLKKYDALSNTTFSAQFMPVILANCFGAMYANQIEWAYSNQSTQYYARGGRLLDNETVACTSTIDYLSDLFQSEKRHIVRSGALGIHEFRNTMNALRMLRSWQIKSGTLYTSPFQSARVREATFGISVRSQYANVNPIGSRKHKTIFLSANVHISKAVLRQMFVNVGYFEGLHSVGYQLHSEMDDEYVAIAQSGFNVTGMFSKAPYPFPNSPVSIDLTLEAYHDKFLLVDTKASWVSKQQWLLHEEGMPNGRYYNLTEAFDAIVFHSVAPKGVWIG